MKQLLKHTLQRFMGVLTSSILGPHVSALVVSSDNGVFAVDPEDYGVGRALRRFGKYGLDEIDRLKPYITLDSRVLVVGAHIGTLAIPISKLCKEVYAVEANPASYDLLRTNIVLNSVTNIQTFNIAAGDNEEHIDFLQSRANSGGSKRVPQTKKYMYYYDKPKTISVESARLDTYLKRNDFDVVVMDIEGSEYYALLGMQEILLKCKLLVVEFLPHHLKHVSGVTVEQFLSVIAPHFSKLSIPSRQISVTSSDFLGPLTEMYNLAQGDEGIMFEKV